MPGLIRPDRNYREASPSKEKDEEGRERESEKKLTGKESGPLECCMILKHTCQNLLMRPSEPRAKIQPPYSAAWEKKKEHKCNEKPNKKI